MFKIIDNKNKKLCCAYRCGNERAKKDRFCHKHRKRYLKETKPASYFYNLLKGNAKRRGKDFGLTLAEFELFCEQTNYLVLKGKTAKSASIDRIDHTRGYYLDNIQMLSLSDNSKKQHTDKNINPDDDCPF